MCAPASTNDEFEKAAALWLALSPPAYFSTNSTDTGGVSVIAPAQDQQSCNTCTALAVVAAAQAAVATTLQLDVGNVLMSAQVAYGCCGVLAEAYAITWTPSDPALLPTLKPRISAANNCYYYTARKGDYLSKVAQQGGVSLQQFLQDNAAQLDDLSKPVVGKRLLVCPAGSSRPAVVVPPDTSGGCGQGRPYVIKTGDTIWKLATEQGTTMEAILAVNPQIKNPDLIFAGQKMCLP
eukprot:gene12069-12210_t